MKIKIKYHLQKFINSLLAFFLLDNVFFFTPFLIKLLKLKKWEYIIEIDKSANDLVSSSAKEYIFSAPYFINIIPIQAERKLNILKTKPVHETLALKNVCIIGSSDLVILESQRIFFPFKEYDIHKKYKYTGNSIIVSNDQMCVLKKMDVHSEIIEIGWKFVHRWTWNYYHFMFELATLFQEIEKSKVQLSVPILIDDVYLKVPQFTEVIKILNKQNRKLIPIKPFTKYRVQHLIIPEPANIIPPNYNDNVKINAFDFLYKADSLKYLRDNLLPYASKKTFQKKIFLSRKNASNRRKYNENEVRELTEKNGYETIYIEGLSFSEQVSLFNGAKSIISASGAALTNLIYCSKGCKILVFTNYSEPFSFFSTIGTFVGAEVKYMFDISKKYTHSNSIHDPFKVDLELLNKYLLALS
jgi:hypothetical protein